MDVDMSNRIQAVTAGPVQFNNYKAPLESITPLHYYTTMGFSHCSSSKCNVPVEDCFRWLAIKDFAFSRAQDSRFTDWPSVSEYQLRPTTTTGKSPTRYKNRAI